MGGQRFETRLFINGEFVEARGPRVWPLVNPATEEQICELREASVEDVDAAVSAASKAFSSWSLQTGARARGEYLFKLADLIEQQKEALAQLESLNVGKPISDSRSDVESSVGILRYYAGWADKLNRGAYVADLEQGDYSCHTRREPVGVVAAIVPWNYPLYLAVLKSAPALVCGCTVVLKSSEKTPLTALKLCELVKQAGLPNGVFNVVNGWGASVGAALTKHPMVNKVSFTGSSAVGRQVAAECAMHVKRVTLELGGKSPLIVLKDADLEKAAAAAWSGLFENSGQCCVACSRIFVQSEIYDKFVDALKDYSAKNARLLDPSDSSCNQGPIVDKVQFNRVMAYIEEGKRGGAVCVTGGQPKGGKGYWVLPTVFRDVTDDMKIAREEIFGPVICVLKFNTIEEAVERANSTPFGLGAGVFTSSISLAEYFVRRLRAGSVWVNCYLKGDQSVPFGGYKESGYGREGGEEGLFPYLETKTVVTRTALD